jgi:NAD(P)-dependent dehydrogenase (short-subunit alcohol dehydrogenase family)
MATAESRTVALVTGANRGIGFETARQLGKLGITVLLGSRTQAKGESAAATLRGEGIDAVAVTLDVNSEASRVALRDHLQSRYGRLDILVNNAGVYLEGEPGGEESFTAESVPESVFRDTMDSNFFAPVALTQLLLPLLRNSTAGRIVNLSSILGSLTLHADPASPIFESRATAYNTSKTALNAWTVHLAKVLRDTPLKVNSAHPGWVQTDMGGAAAPLSIIEGAKTSVRLATLPSEGPSGGFFHQGNALPW